VILAPAHSPHDDSPFGRARATLRSTFAQTGRASASLVRLGPELEQNALTEAIPGTAIIRRALKQAMLAFAPLMMLADHADRWIAQPGTFGTFEFWHPGVLALWHFGTRACRGSTT